MKVEPSVKRQSDLKQQADVVTEWTRCPTFVPGSPGSPGSPWGPRNPGSPWKKTKAEAKKMRNVSPYSAGNLHCSTTLPLTSAKHMMHGHTYSKRQACADHAKISRWLVKRSPPLWRPAWLSSSEVFTCAKTSFSTANEEAVTLPVWTFFGDVTSLEFVSSATRVPAVGRLTVSKNQIGQTEQSGVQNRSQTCYVSEKSC